MRAQFGCTSEGAVVGMQLLQGGERLLLATAAGVVRSAPLTSHAQRNPLAGVHIDRAPILQVSPCTVV